MPESSILTSDPRDGTRRAMDYQASESSKIPIGVEQVAWQNATGKDRIPVLNWNPDDEPVDDPISTMPDSVLRESFGVGDAEPGPLSFFNGKPYADGVKAYNEFLASKGPK